LESGFNNIGISNLDLFLGRNLAGCIGETSKVAIIIGFVYLCVCKVIDFRWPIIYVATTGLFAVALNGFDFNWFLPSILSGGLMYVAVFMATDYVTTPNTGWGNTLYFIGLGLLTAGLRMACKTEVVTFAVLLMNITVPLIDKWIVPKPFGYVKKQRMPKTPVSDAKRTASASKEAQK
jgi:electron transport complex protein RnfD